MNKHRRYPLIVAAMCSVTSLAQAGIHSEDWSGCLVESTTSEDTFSLVQ